MKYKFEQVIIIGSGLLAENCIKHISNFEIPVTIYNSNINALSVLKNTNDYGRIKYHNLKEEEMFKELCMIKKRTLVFLIVCNYLIPNNVINNKNLSIINYHNALLPRHRGRNAEAWAIYEQDSITGITWHFIDSGIDTGDIIIQKKIVLEDSISSISLLRLQNQIAFDAFKLIINNLLEGNIISFKQDNDSGTTLHFAKDIPNDGFLDIEWDIKKIKAFLRAMDYGALRTMGQPKVKLNNIIYTWRKEKISNTNIKENSVIHNEEEKYILITKEEKVVKLMNVYMVGGM